MAIVKEMDKQKEIISKLKETFSDKTIISREELNKYFTKLNPEISSGALRNRIFHLVRFGILSAISSDLYTFDVKLTWKPLKNETIDDVWELVSGEIYDNNCCFWTTKWLNEFANLQAFNEIVFIEIDSIIAEPIYHSIASRFNNVFYHPDQKEHEYYISTKESSYIVRQLITKAPIIGRFVYSPKRIFNTQTALSPPMPRLEKLLTDLFYDEMLLAAWKYEEVNIWQNAYEKYNLNFSTIYNYAKRRDKSAKILEFIYKNIHNLPDDIIRFLQQRSDSAVNK